MRYRLLTSHSLLAVVIAVLAMATTMRAGQAPAEAVRKPGAAEAAAVPRTADGHPDLRGVWDFRTITPMQRPTGLAGKDVLDDHEAAEFEVKNRRNQDNREATAVGVVNGTQSNPTSSARTTTSGGTSARMSSARSERRSSSIRRMAGSLR